MDADIIIIGAGAAGLAAAQRLVDAGRSVIIIEARDRMGGRIHTHPRSTSSAPIELGAEFIHGRPESTLGLVDLAGLTAIEVPFAHSRVHRGKLIPFSDLSATLKTAMSGLTRLGRQDISFAQYLRRYPHGSPEARRFATHFVEGFDAADPERISAKSIAEEQEGIGDLEGQTQFRLLQGYGALIEFLHRSIGKRAKIHLETPVSEIRWQRHAVEVIIGIGRKASSWKAKQAIVTLPLGVLQIPPELPNSVRFSPDVASHRLAAAHLASGAIVKVVLHFQQAFWESSAVGQPMIGGISPVFFHHLGAAIPTWWTQSPLRVPILTGWAGGSKARALAGLPEQAVLSTVLVCLEKLFRMRRNRLRTLLQDFYVYDWASDPYARGAYSYTLVGGQRARGGLAKSVEDTLFFAGEATDTSGQTSTVAGAIASGYRAADEIMSA